MAARSKVSQEFAVAFAAILSLAGVVAQAPSADAQAGHGRQTVTGMRPAPGATVPPNAPTSSAAATNRPGNAEQAPGSGSKSARDRMADSQYASAPELPPPTHLGYTDDLQTCSIHGARPEAGRPASGMMGSCWKARRKTPPPSRKRAASRNTFRSRSALKSSTIRRARH